MMPIGSQLARFILLVMTAMIPVPAAWAAPSSAAEPREITVREAQALVKSALPRTTTQLSKFSIEFGKNSSTSRFYSLSALWSGEGAISVMIGNYWVDRRTGDVWNAAICEELTSPDLETAKERLRTTIGLSKLKYKKLRIKGPMC